MAQTFDVQLIAGDAGSAELTAEAEAMPGLESYFPTVYRVRIKGKIAEGYVATCMTSGTTTFKDPDYGEPKTRELNFELATVAEFDGITIDTWADVAPWEGQAISEIASMRVNYIRVATAFIDRVKTTQCKYLTSLGYNRTVPVDSITNAWCSYVDATKKDHLLGFVKSATVSAGETSNEFVVEVQCWSSLSNASLHVSHSHGGNGRYVKRDNVLVAGDPNVSLRREQVLLDGYDCVEIKNGALQNHVVETEIEESINVVSWTDNLAHPGYPGLSDPRATFVYEYNGQQIESSGITVYGCPGQPMKGFTVKCKTGAGWRFIEWKLTEGGVDDPKTFARDTKSRNLEVIWPFHLNSSQPWKYIEFTAYFERKSGLYYDDATGSLMREESGGDKLGCF